MKTEFDTIKDLYDAVQRGEIKGEDLVITLDNDCTSFESGPRQTEDGIEFDSEYSVKEVNGYYDIEPLYKLLFPKAEVNWC